ncbi:2OG-Fe(II) oxygenase, partial [bacterium]|nr:2OG-Fe(II) oxygenase [bacterium]
MNPETIVNLELHPIQDSSYIQKSKDHLDSKGALVMEDFLNSKTITSLQTEAKEVRHLAYFCHQNHN